MKYAGIDMSSIYKEVCRDILMHGQCVTTRGLLTKEVFNAQVELYKPRARFVNFKERDMNMRYCVGELCHYLDGRTDLKSIAHYGKFWERVSDDGKTINSCYGNRLFKLRYRNESSAQFKYAVECLVQDKNSRKAVMMIYERQDARPSRDNPCTISLQLVIRDNELYMFTNMRSQDVWLGVPYDFAFFTIVQEIALVLLRTTYPKLKFGSYMHNVTSLHMYETNFDQCSKLINERDHAQYFSPEITIIDVHTWFDDLLTYEKYKRGVVLYKSESERTEFQDWCKEYI